MASKPGGLNITKSLQPRENSPYGSRCTVILLSCRVSHRVTKADVSWEETGIGTRRIAGVWVQASGERFATSARMSWARLLKRVFDIDIEHCPHCGGTLKIIAAIEEPTVIAKILAHLGLPTRAPPRAPARSFVFFEMA